jgi:hypothetical protein
MKDTLQKSRSGLLSTLSLLFFIAASMPAFATGNIVKSDLTGTWRMELHGNTGCGFSTMWVIVQMSSGGSGNALLETHGQCGDSDLKLQTFTVKTLTAKGTGTATLSCGTGCGWLFNIQVAPDRSKFNLSDTSDPGNYLEGVAVLSSPAGLVTTPDMTGVWQMVLLGQTGCGLGTTDATFTMNSSGVASGVVETSHSVGCGDGVSNSNTFTINSMNADGSGLAGLSCGPGCGFAFAFQVSPDRSTMNLVDISDPGNFLSGVAIRTSSAGAMARANFAGPWQLALYGQSSCGNAATLVNFTMNAKGISTNATEKSHSSGCGDTTLSGNTLILQGFNIDGSGTATLTCGAGCTYNFNYQMSPDRSTIAIVDVSPSDPGKFLVGKAIHQ